MSNKTPLLKNLLRELVIHERIKTTQAKARELKSLVDRIISYAKKGKQSKYYLQRYLPEKLIEKVIDKIAPGFANRQSGFTRVFKLGKRLGDNAPITLIEFVKKVEIEKPVITKDTKDIKKISAKSGVAKKISKREKK